MFPFFMHPGKTANMEKNRYYAIYDQSSYMEGKKKETGNE